MTINRRRTLALFGSGAGLCLPGIALGRATAAIRFDHGVASGDPAADGAVLWTRATPVDPEATGDVALRWHVALAADGDPVASGTVTARAARDFTAKAMPTGLRPGTDHWFWFEGREGLRSPVGRFRTLPVGATVELRFAVVSCQLYGGGLYTVYDAIAPPAAARRGAASR
ncbi:MAG: PhoD-like phosphatase N-terminal domain-containing protein [Sphingomonas taxi]